MARQVKIDFSASLGLPRKTKKGLEAAQLVLFRRLVDETPSVSGNLRNGWKLDKIENVKSGQILASATVSNNRVYLSAINDGTKPPHGPYGRKGIKRVSLWARRKLKLDKKEARNFAFAYRQKLYKTGMIVRLGGQKGYGFIEEAQKKAASPAARAFVKAFRNAR